MNDIQELEGAFMLLLTFYDNLQFLNEIQTFFFEQLHLFPENLVEKILSFTYTNKVHKH